MLLAQVLDIATPRQHVLQQGSEIAKTRHPVQQPAVNGLVTGAPRNVHPQTRQIVSTKRHALRQALIGAEPIAQQPHVQHAHLPIFGIVTTHRPVQQQAESGANHPIQQAETAIQQAAHVQHAHLQTHGIAIQSLTVRQQEAIGASRNTEALITVQLHLAHPINASPQTHGTAKHRLTAPQQARNGAKVQADTTTAAIPAQLALKTRLGIVITKMIVVVQEANGVHLHQEILIVPKLAPNINVLLIGYGIVIKILVQEQAVNGATILTPADRTLQHYLIQLVGVLIVQEKANAISHALLSCPRPVAREKSLNHNTIQTTSA